jgi:hypothetical protein
MILPAVIKKGNAALHRTAYQAYRSLFIFGITKMVAAESKRRDSHVVPAKLAHRDAVASRILGHN